MMKIRTTAEISAFTGIRVLVGPKHFLFYDFNKLLAPFMHAAAPT
jgi:hypothetical protein